MIRFTRTLLTVVVALSIMGVAIGAAVAQSAKLTVQVDKPGHKISPSLWGVFFEEINLAGDGGLYAELIRNRSFEDSDKPEYWTVTGPQGGSAISIAIDTSLPSTAGEFNKKSLRLDVKSAGPGAAVANGGWYGIAVEKGAKYNLSLMVRKSADYTGGLIVSLQGAEPPSGADGQVYASAKISKLSGDWKTLNAKLKSNATDPKARLVITPTSSGTVWLDVVSLFPAKTWKNRPNGLRPQLADMLVGLKPAFVRFPGGCWVEGATAETSMRWKQTIGPISDRRTLPNLWGYMSPNGLGFYEYLQMCEDLNAEALYVINCGMSHGAPVPMDKMDEFVQDALDAIEYANGPATSKWGSVRAKAGHPKPFNLKYMEIGNENGGPAYMERWKLIATAVRAKYPDVQLIGDDWAGGRPTDPMPDLIDEHCYTSPESFIAQADKYDSYDRKGPKIYMGEYACTEGCGKGNLRAAIGEAAYMTGMERNSDIVVLASYAPLFVHLEHRAWNPDLINFDSSRVYAIPSYYAQQMFAYNTGDTMLPVNVISQVTEGKPNRGAVSVGTWKTQSEYKDIVVTQGDKTLYSSDFSKGKEGWKFGTGKWDVVDGCIRQTSDAGGCRATVGDPSWTDYTLTLKARKISGDEGFLIGARVASESSYVWWNLGGWGNIRHAIQVSGTETGKSVNGSIETGRWYDIKVVVKGDQIKCYLDGKLLNEATLPKAKSMFSSASKDSKTGDIIVKVVNTLDSPMTTDMTLAGMATVGSKADVTVLTSADGKDENTVDEPTKVSPKKTTMSVTGTSFNYTFPAQSLTVFRFKSK